MTTSLSLTTPQNVGNFRVIVKKDASGLFAVYRASDGSRYLVGMWIHQRRLENSVWVYQRGISGKIFTLDFGRFRAISQTGCFEMHL
ncbi:MAG: hypothetical protein IPM83_11405 [Ignavibacteria bacterium]|nr:hypothetical protein [Ignavibacteria bacterium]